MVAKKNVPAVELPGHSRIVVPVLAAVGGSGRSTVAGLLAASLASSARSVVLDLAPRLASPWPGWTTEPGTGLASVPPAAPLSRRRVLAAATRLPGPADDGWQVLTDHREWSAPPLPLPADPAAWYQLAAIGGWQAVVADTSHPMAHDLVASRSAGRSGLTAAWCGLPVSVPVVCAAATGSGMAALQTALSVAAAEGLALERTVVALVSTGDGRAPASVRAGETMLAPRVAAVVRVPYDPGIRARGLRDASRLDARSVQAADRLTRAVIASAHASWGDPLPAAARPAAAPVQTRSAEALEAEAVEGALL
ncbi:hypothetical protein [Kitasatospora xanthocidica]|uniref:hypothetical protein n=1 Tax=Kitasatospora xanthocidica TaxID=83382 RepID=UPI001E52D376|nr:hypothetical protein [Kitasatospora xanthocidica]